MNPVRILAGVLAGTLLLSAPALAQAPSFDCGKASGQVEELICKDAGLAALDDKLAGVYKAAAATSGGEPTSFLKAEQRGWIKGRDECWKADDLRACVESEYTRRIAQLQALYRLVPSKGPVFYGCNGNPGNEIVATFFETDPPTAVLERGDRSVVTYLVPAGSGAKYEGRNVTFWTKGDEASASWLNPVGETEELKCTVKTTR
jgi:uncharacterized protein